ncbi:MAG: hypothetical protein O2958_00380 [Gemmatimonadetes bacterium]|nr:hypothetical protein [Gemmatimonadota bacterium]MDA1102745.1 hypothetical protein [Gemmatimonadota bacterium]
MSEQDQVKPFHAKDVAPGQEAADVVAEVLKHAAAREQASKRRETPKGPPKWMLPLTLNLGVLALYFLIAQPDFLVVNPLDDPRPPAEVIASTRTAMYFDGISRIESFRAANGRLPATLVEAGSQLAAQGIDYSVQGDSTYLLITTIQTETIVYDSATQTAADFAGNLARALPG